MAKPVLITVDDDPEVLQAVERDLRRQYGDRFRIVRAESGEAALDVLKQLNERGSVVALLLSDHRMPGMDGVTFLEEAKKLFPAAKRVLLTAYADTDAAIRAINDVRVDHYLLKPWDPPEELLYPVLDDLLADWAATFRPPWEGIRVLGNRWSPPSHTVKDFLARNQVPYQWLDIEAQDTDAEVRRLVSSVGDCADHLPLVLFPDGTTLPAPTVTQIAEKVGLTTHAKLPFYDLVVVGAGPAGLAAAVYGASEGLSTVIIEREAPGGQAGTSSRIENYLGFPSGLSGSDLARRAVDQAKRFGVEILAPQEVVEVRVNDPYRILKLASGSEISCHALLLATGVAWRRLEIPGLDRLTGAGVYYGAAVTEALSCRDEDVYVVGGANSAGQAAMYLSRFAGKVTLLVRGDSLRKGMSDYLVDQVERTPNIEVRLNTNVVAVEGESHLECITLDSGTNGERETVPASTLFILIGATPHTDWLEGVVARDDAGFLLSGPELPRDERTGRVKNWPLDRDPYLLETSVPGIFVAGDVRRGSVKRIASGVGEGGVAVSGIHQYLSKV